MLSISNSLLVLSSLFSFVSMVFIIRGNWKNATNIFFGIFLGFLALWAGVLIAFQISNISILSIYYGNFAYISALGIGVSLYLFSIVFPENKKPKTSTIVTTFGVLFVFTFLLLNNPTFLIKKIDIWQNIKDVEIGIFGYIVFAAPFAFFYIGGLIRIWKKYFHAKGIIKKQLLIIGLSVSLAGIGGAFYNLILASPFFQDFQYLWSGPLFNTIIAISVMYSIFSLRLFNAKVITTELLISLLWIFTFVRTLLAGNFQEQFLNGGLFLLSFVIGLLLIKSVRKEVDAKEENVKLAEGLEMANEQLKAIDERKSDFINIASHQLRTPTTAIKGYTALLLDGDYGEVPEKEKEIIQRMNNLADQNVKIIADMLNISRIEQNRMKYTFERVEIAQFILDIIHTLKIKAEGKNLPLDYTFDKTLNDSLTTDKKVYAQVDKTLLAQVFENVIDNSVKYTQKGSVDIDIRLEGKKLIFKCKDTGIGIDKESIATLFKKFGRSKNAQESGIEGTGIGLYIAKDIMEKHHGDITISSEGEGKGSESIVTLEIE